MSTDLDALYQEIILDHYKNPHHKGLRDPFESEVHHVNPTCGDEVTLRVHLADGPDGAVVGDVSYDSVGCSISQASASVMADLVIGKPVDEAMSIHQTFLELMQGKVWWIDMASSTGLPMARSAITEAEACEMESRPSRTTRPGPPHHSGRRPGARAG